jgi:colanic acid/amylovoran biosynthesis glycosyltransferase
LIYVIKGKKRFVSFYNVIHFLDKPNYDIVHAHYGFSGKIVADFKSIGLLRKSKMVTTFHGFDFIVENGYYQRLFQLGDKFTVNTNYSRQKLVELGCPENKICILPVGFDAKLFNTSNIKVDSSNSVFTIIFIGRLYAIKAPDFFISICELLKYQHNILFRVWVVGDGDMYNQLQEMIVNKGLSEEVALLGSRKQSEIQELFQQSDVFVLTGSEVGGYAETQGLVVQEAQAMGLPVVVSDVRGYRRRYHSG